MIAQQIRDAIRAAPFVPFRIHTANGRAFDIPHQEFLSMSVTGRTVYVHTEAESVSVLDTLLITELEIPANGAKTS